MKSGYDTGPGPKDRWLALLEQALQQGSFVKLTLGDPVGADPTLKNIFVRPVLIGAGPRLSFVHRHATRDITKNLGLQEGVRRVADLLGTEFHSGHLFSTTVSAQVDFRRDGRSRLRLAKPRHTAPAVTAHDQVKQRALPVEGMAWLQALGVTVPGGAIARGMESKFRQIQKFCELLQHLLGEVRPAGAGKLTLADMGCGKGYLTFAAYDGLRRAGWTGTEVLGVETRPELVELCNRVATECSCAKLRFERGDITGAALAGVDVLVALHACDTATDDAIARGIQEEASLILVSPCCHKELRAQLVPPAVLSGALRHGILRERHAEFVTDALRAGLLEWAGYETRVFEFIATEHTAKNLMIAALRRPGARDLAEPARRVRELASCYGIRSQRLAAQLGFDLESASEPPSLKVTQ